MKPQKYLLPAALVLVFLILLGAAAGIFGVPAARLEQDARLSHKIDNSWLSAIADPTEDMAAMVFYSPEKDDFTFSIYVNRPGVSFGWFFRGGGSIVQVQTQVAEFAVENIRSRAYVSLNAQRLIRVEFGDGTSLPLDPEAPFAIVVPAHRGSVRFLSESGEWVEPVSQRL